MLTERASGILVHPTSFPTRFGVGDLGPSADAFLDWLAAAGQRCWQVLPLRCQAGLFLNGLDSLFQLCLPRCHQFALHLPQLGQLRQLLLPITS